MRFNSNIILEVLKSNFAEEITLYVHKCIGQLDEYDLSNIFESEADYALADFIEGIEVEDFSTEDENDGKKVEGTLEIIVSISGYDDRTFIGTGNIILGIGFSFHVENEKYTNVEFEYLY